MTRERVFRAGGQALAIGAVLELTGSALSLLNMTVPAIPGVVLALLLEAADVATALGIIAWYGSQMVETGKLGFNGLVVALTGLLFGIAGFFTPYVWLLYLVGLAMLAAATRRARRYPTGIIWIWLVGSFVALGGSVVGILALQVFGIALSCLCRFQFGRAIMARFPDRVDLEGSSRCNP